MYLWTSISEKLEIIKCSDSKLCCIIDTTLLHKCDSQLFFFAYIQFAHKEIDVCAYVCMSDSDKFYDENKMEIGQ